MMRIVVDIYGADGGPAPILEGVAAALQEDLAVFPVLVGESGLITDFMNKAGIHKSRYEILDTQEFIGPCDPPHCIFGGRDNSSMALGYGRLKSDDSCCALLSAGNTGALRFYEEYGFRRIGEAEGANGGTLYLMEKEL